MIYSIYIIDITQSGIPLVEYSFKDLGCSDEDGPRSKVFDEFFNNIGKTIKKIREEDPEHTIHSEFTRILLVADLNVIIHYCGIGEFVVCSINDLDDNKEKILEAIEALARRFYQKHRTDLQEFRYSNKTHMFKSFQIDIMNLTLNGNIGEEYPMLIINQKTLERLKKMSIISHEEYLIAKHCEGTNSPFKIAEILDEDYDNIKSALTKLTNLDIIEKSMVSIAKK